MSDFRDPIHNFIPFAAKEMDLINSPVLQRLRRIRQLAMAHLVYPGALHTRFDHTLGVAYIAGEMARILRLDDHERQLVRYAALLHDIGHGPFSHVSETALDRFAKAEIASDEQKTEKIHEQITSHLIRNNQDIVHILGRQDCDQIADLLTTGFGEPVLRAIVSGPLDADKQDYLLRDSRFCGVTYGIFDLDQLQRSFVCTEINHQRDLMIDRDGVHVVEQFVLAKYYLTSMVYRHKVRLITDEMITRAIFLGVNIDGLIELHRLYNFDESSDFYENYLEWNDAKFLLKFGDEGLRGSRCKELIDRLLSRHLHKRVFHAPPKEFPAEIRETLLEIDSPHNDKLRGAIESELASLLQHEFNASVDADFTILHSYQIKSVRESSRNDERSILITRPNQTPGQLETESVLFESIDERSSDRFVDVYAPVQWSTVAGRSRLLQKLDPLIKEIIGRMIPTAQPQLRL